MIQWPSIIKRLPRILGDWWQTLDWYLLIPTGCFVLIVLLVFVSDTQQAVTPYQAAILDAAVRKPPHLKVELSTFPDTTKEETFVTLKHNCWHPDPALTDNCDKTNAANAQQNKDSTPTTKPAVANYIWLTIPSELKKQCRDKTNSLKTIQQILGLPEDKRDFKLFKLRLKLDKVRRPCFSGSNLQDKFCTFNLPEPPVLPKPAEGKSYSEEEVEKLIEDYKRLRFLNEQMLTSWRDGFSRAGAPEQQSDAYGFPFTGMGWTYNWDPERENHIGVSEFIIDEADIPADAGKDSQSPEEFCNQDLS